jgi:hypothetical protein
MKSWLAAFLGILISLEAGMAQAPEITMPMRVTPTPTPVQAPTPLPTPTPPPPPEQRVFPELDALQAALDKTESQAAIPGLAKYLKDIEALKKQYMLRGEVQSSQAAEAEIVAAKRNLKNAGDVVSGVRKPIHDRMTAFLWGTDDAKKLPAERMIVYYNSTNGFRKKVLFHNDGTLLRTDNTPGTWWIENGNLILVLLTGEGQERTEFPAVELSKTTAGGKITTGTYKGHKIELSQAQ